MKSRNHPEKPRRTVITLVLLLLLTLTPCLYLLSGPVVEGQPGLPLDDSYIHLVYARNLAEHGFLTFDGKNPSAGTSSPLWTLWLAGCIKIGATGETAAVVSGLIFHLLTGLTLWLFFRSCPGFAPSVCLLMAILTIGLPNVSWFAVSGMETSLFLFLTAQLLLHVSRRAHTAAALPALLLPLVRPEGMVFSGLAVLILFEQTRRVRKEVLPATGSWIHSLAATGLGVFLLAAIYRLHSNSWLPQTSFSRRWIWDLPTDSLLVFPNGLASFIVQVFSFLKNFAFGWPSSQLARTAKFPALPGPAADIVSTVIVLALFAIFILGVIRAAGKRSSVQLRLPVAFFFAHLGFFLCFLPVPGGAGRYLAPCFLLGTMVLFLEMKNRTGPSRRRWLLFLLLFLLLNARGWFLWHALHKDAVAHLNRAHGRVAAYIEKNIADGTRVAAFDIGKLQWETDCSIIDISGLVNREVAGSITAKTLPQYIESKDIPLLAMIHTFSPDNETSFHRELGFDEAMTGYRELYSAAAWPHRYFMHVRALNNAYPVMTLYAREKKQ